MEKFATIKDRIDANGALANNAYGNQNIFFPSVRSSSSYCSPCRWQCQPSLMLQLLQPELMPLLHSIVDHLMRYTYFAECDLKTNPSLLSPGQIPGA